MPSQPPLPPLLTPYLLTQPESSLTLVSSILGATSNWLVLRFLHAALSTSSTSNSSIGLEDLPDGKKKKVVLVSFLRGWEFWKSEAKRLVSQISKCFIFPNTRCTAWMGIDAQGLTSPLSLISEFTNNIPGP